MTEIEQHTMSRDDAERLTERIRMVATTFMETRDKLARLVREAQEGGAHKALGFRSWTEYIAQVFSDTPLMRLTTDERRVIVADLSGEGVSRPAIAAVVGVAERTVQRDFRSIEQGETPVSPSTPAEPTFDPTPSWDPVDTTTGEIHPDPRPVTGLDGKTYARPEPKETPKPAAAPGREAAIVNDIRLYLGHIATSSEVASLSTEGRRHIITALENTLTALRSKS